MQACAQELSRGQQVWSQVVANDAVQSFQADPHGAAYLAALQHIWRIALLLQAAADLHGLAHTAQPQHRAAFELASRQSMGAVVGEYSSPCSLLARFAPWRAHAQAVLTQALTACMAFSCISVYS